MLALLLAAQVAIASGAPPHRPAPATSESTPTPVPAPAPGPSTVITLHYGDVVAFRPATAPGGTAMIIAAGEAARSRVLQPGEVRTRFDRFGQGESLLVVENMSDAFLDYQAVMTLADGSSQPTNVCTLLPHGRPSFEHWPQAIATLTLFGFHGAPDQTVSCR